MYVNFDSLPGHARLWVYMGSRKFTSAEEEIITEKARLFCEQWVAHGEPLKTSFAIAYHQFLIFAVDEEHHDASGCSIDGSVRLLKSLNYGLGIDFLDHSKVGFLKDGEVAIIAVSELKNAFSDGTLNGGTLTFNVQLADKEAWKNRWLLPVQDSWLARHLPKTPVSR